MQLSVVILNYNVKHFLELCIKSVQRAIASIDAEIIVVDNASTDGSKEMMEALFPNIKYIYNEANYGFTVANNIGVKHAKGEYICILNPDTIVGEDCFISILSTYQKLEKPGILGCKLIDGSGNFLPESKRGVPTPWVAFTKIAGLYKLFPKNLLFNQYYAQHIKPTQIGETDTLVGAFMFMKKEHFTMVGGFDEGCFMYSDDVDLSYMIQKKGLKNYYIGNISTVHFKGESTDKNQTYITRFRDAMLFFYKKHFKVSKWFAWVMNIGIFLFSFKKSTEKGKKTPKPTAYYLISSQKDIIQKLENKFGNKLKIFETINELPTNNKEIEILVDAELITYKSYIALLEQFKNQRKTFKIRPKGANFYIGSNDKNGKGEILPIND